MSGVRFPPPAPKIHHLVRGLAARLLRCNDVVLASDNQTGATDPGEVRELRRRPARACLAWRQGAPRDKVSPAARLGGELFTGKWSVLRWVSSQISIEYR